MKSIGWRTTTGMPSELMSRRVCGGQSRRKEDDEYASSFPRLREKNLSKDMPLLRDKPVYGIGGTRSRDWKRMYNAAVLKGNGAPEQRRHVEEMIRTADEKNECLMKELAKVSTRSRVVFARESGHFVQLTQPEIVVDGVRWVLENTEV